MRPCVLAVALITAALPTGGCTETAAAAQDRSQTSGKAAVRRDSFGTMPDGAAVDIFTLTNGRGMEVRTIPYGAIIVSIKVPDRAGRFEDVVLGFDDLDGYVKRRTFFGAVVGRYGNRIAKGRFTLDGKTYELATNNGPNHLHGGVKGFDSRLWRAEPFDRNGTTGVVYSLTSPDGDEGYPGTVNARVTYTLTPANELIVDYEATSDRATPINLTQHSFFNLAGEGRGDVLGHRLTLDADRFTPVDKTLIPTGELAPVAGTPFDFRKPATIGARINDDNEQLHNGTGYDHNFVLNRSGTGLAHAAHVEDPASGRTLDISTTEPGVQFYSGNFLDGSVVGKSGHAYKQRYALCLETQHFPDSPNHANFPSTILRPGGRYQSKTVFAFGTVKP